MKKIRVRKKKKSNVFIILIILILITLYISFKFLNKKSKELFMEYSVIETRKIVSKVVTDSINNELLTNIDNNSFFIINRNSNDKIESIDINSKYINTILSNSNKLLDNNLSKLEQEKYIFLLPLFNNKILSNIFPKIPIRIEIIGSTLCIINTKIESYGINNALFKVDLEISVDVRILLPFVSEITNINVAIPLVIKLIEGDIPNYLYSDYFNKTYTN